MSITQYSHAFLIGSFKENKDANQLDTNLWKIERISLNGENKRYKDDNGYGGLCSIYYKGHLDAMIKAFGQETIPEFVQPVAHFVCDRTAERHENIHINYHTSDGTLITLYNYQLEINRLHIYFFPLNIVIYAIELDDSGSDLNDLTMAHSLLATWAWEKETNTFSDATKAQLAKALQPLKGIAFNSNYSTLNNEGNKLKIFQCIKVEKDMMTDETLYEIGTSCPIGCVNKDGCLTPSKQYFQTIMNENSIHAFKNWKGLALMDTFTILGVENSFNEDYANFLYFPLIYLRCIFEKSFCFSRNSAYRRGEKSEDIVKEIADMERYYFYDNISYNFLPNMLYKVMSKGLCIKEERQELSLQVKERAKADLETKQKK